MSGINRKYSKKQTIFEEDLLNYDRDECLRSNSSVFWRDDLNDNENEFFQLANRSLLDEKNCHDEGDEQLIKEKDERFKNLSTSTEQEKAL